VLATALVVMPMLAGMLNAKTCPAVAVAGINPMIVPEAAVLSKIVTTADMLVVTRTEHKIPGPFFTVAPAPRVADGAGKVFCPPCVTRLIPCVALLMMLLFLLCQFERFEIDIVLALLDVEFLAHRVYGFIQGVERELSRRLSADVVSVSDDDPQLLIARKFWFGFHISS
jgi:hypothetical protein